MACILAAALLFCASSAYAQVIEPGGFPVKSGDISEESFSLSCPSRLYAQPGESILFSCTAGGVPEEGVRYEWRSVSGEGLRLLSNAQVLDPLFIVSLSGGREYGYRLTATGPGVYATASVTVTVEGVSGKTVRAPVLREECDPLRVPDEPGQDCMPWGGAEPFGYGPEEEGDFLFPEAPAPPDQLSGPVRGEGSDSQAPPRLDCPAAVFLEELETSFIECHAWDASGQDYLEYSWEPAGGTTRDYLENPRLIPEDSPHPSVIAPETPAYETLESFRSSETTFRYRYRLTATSRATGLSSHEEVEVYVSSNRPSVYCPLEVLVEEGGTVTLDCEGADPFSSRMDYDEEAASVLWEWEGLWGTSTVPLAATDLSSPLFTAPAGSAGEEYHYIASMTTLASGVPRTARRRVTVTVIGAEEGTHVAADDSSPMFQGNAPSIMCEDAEAYEATADFTLDCSVTDKPSGATYSWTGTDVGARLMDTSSLTPTFSVPREVGGSDKQYDYTVTLSAGGAAVATADIAVTVLEKPDIDACVALGFSLYEGSREYARLQRCSHISGAPGPNPVYRFVWTTRGDTPDTALSLLSSRFIEAPLFKVPEEVSKDEVYEYAVTISADNADPYTYHHTVTVRNRELIDIACEGNPYTVYEGSEDVAFDCEASGAPSGSAYSYAWAARGNTPDTALLDDPNIASPTFAVPGTVTSDETYEYSLTVSASNAGSASAEVTVKVLNRKALALVCSDPVVYEGSADLVLDCTASGAPSGSAYSYVWAARGDTPDTALLSATNIASPTFAVPGTVTRDETYEYLLTVSAENAEDTTAEVTVTVLNRRVLSVTCASPGSVYEGSADVAFDCEASGAPAGYAYNYAWTARGDTQDTSLLSATNIASPMFYVPNDVAATTTYEYLLTVSAANAQAARANVTVTVLNVEPLVAACADPGSVYEGSEDITFDCTVSGAPAGSNYTYGWTAWGDTPDTALLSNTRIASPTFYVPEEVAATTTYEYLLRTSAEHAEHGDDIHGSARVTVTVLNKEALAVACSDPGSAYEGSEDIAFDCEASGAPEGSAYASDWTAIGDTQDASMLSVVTDMGSPTFYVTFHVPDEVIVTTTYEYLLTVSAENAEDASTEVSVTVLNKEPLAVACADPGSAYEGAEDIAFDCSASGAPEGSAYAYAWTAVGDTQDTSLLSATDVASPTFFVPDEVDEDETHEYLLTVSAENAVAGTAEVTVTVLARAPLAFVDDSISGRVYVFTVGEAITDVLLPEATGGLPLYTYTLTPALPEGLELDGPARTISGTPLEVSPRSEYAWQVTDVNTETVQIAFFIEVVPAVEPTVPPVASSSARESSDPSALGVTVSVSSLRFGAQSAETQASLDPMTDRISTYLSGPYHAGRMTLSPGGSEALDENGEMDLSIELASPVVLRREGGIEAASLVLAPAWSYAESCEQLSSQTIGGLYTEVTLSEDACRLLRFGGELDLADAPPGQYAGNIDIVLRSGEREETFAVETSVTVVAAQRVITIGSGGVRFSTSREVYAGLTEEQNLSIYPDVAFLTEGKPDGVFELSNPSLIPLEISVSARFGYTEATEQGREVVVEDMSQSRLGDLSGLVDIHPGVLVLQPGEKGLVRYGLKEEAPGSIADKGYAAFFDVASAPRSYADLDRMPEEVTEERTARVTMRVPGVYVPGEGASQLRARLLSISYPGSLSATFLLETVDHPFAGEVVAYDGAGRELGRRETLVYTRSRVRIPLDRMPEEGAVFLRFSPRGSSRAPLPTSVEWNAPGRDVGDAGQEDRARIPATLVRKP